MTPEHKEAIAQAKAVLELALDTARNARKEAQKCIAARSTLKLPFNTPEAAADDAAYAAAHKMVLTARRARRALCVFMALAEEQEVTK